VIPGLYISLKFSVFSLLDNFMGFFKGIHTAL